MGVARAVASILCFLAMALPAPAQELPGGSYLSSCREVKVRSGRDLAAICPTRDGAWVVALLENFPSCRGDISNKDGKLSCSRGASLFGFDSVIVTPPTKPVANAGTVPATVPATTPATSFATTPPPGSYLSSCRDVRVSSGWLQASCQDRYGRWVEAVTALGGCVPGRDIVNDDGRLICVGIGGGTRPPMGSYLATCRDVRVEIGWLKASCQDRNGRFVESTTALSWCASGEIVNDDGRLTCRSAGGFGERPPPGSYMASCRDVRVVAGWLKASCRDRSGRWVEATTAVSWCSAGRDIANDDGRLTCR